MNAPTQKDPRLVALGERIRNLRDELNWRQQDLTEYLGIPGGQGEVSRWENGHKAPPPDKLVKLAELAGEPVHVFAAVLEQDFQPTREGFEDEWLDAFRSIWGSDESLSQKIMGTDALAAAIDRITWARITAGAMLRARAIGASGGLRTAIAEAAPRPRSRKRAAVA